MSEVELAYHNGNQAKQTQTHDSGLILQTFYSFDDAEAIRDEWDGFMESVEGEIFLTYDWCRTWWKYYGLKRDLAIFVCRDHDGICGILPFFFERIWLGLLSVSITRMVGSDFVPATITLPIKQDRIDQVLNAVIGAMNRHWHWHLMHVGTICGRYEHADALLSGLQTKMGHEFESELKESGTQTYFAISSGWDAQVASLARKQRTNLRRTFRETDAKGIEITINRASESNLQTMMDSFIRMHQTHWRQLGNAGHFAAWPSATEFHKEVAELQFRRDRLRLIEISFNGTPVGYEYVYKFHDTYCWFLNSRADFEGNSHIDFKWIAFRAKVESALRDGVKTIDGMRGMYDYKLLMGGRAMATQDLFVYSKHFPTKQRVMLFRLSARLMDIVYYKIWRARIAPRLGIRLGCFWRKWVRFHPLSS